MDFSVEPCDDFYKFSCGKWQEDHPFPQYLTGWDYFNKLFYSMRTDLRKILDSKPIADTQPKAMSKLYNFYKGCSNEAIRNANGYSALMKKVDELGGWPSTDPYWNESVYDWEEALIKLVKLDISPIVDIAVVLDAKDTTHPMIEIGTFSMAAGSNIHSKQFGIKRQKPKVNHYFSNLNEGNDAYFDKIKLIMNEIYNNSMPIDDTKLKNDLNDTLLLVNDLNNAQTATYSTQYYQQHYNDFKFKVKDLSGQFPSFNWLKLLTKLFPTLDAEDTVFIPDINFVQKFGQIIAQTDKKVLANYFAITLVSQLGDYTTPKMHEILYNEKLDAPEILPNICYQALEDKLPDLLGRLFVDTYFNRHRNEAMSDMREITSLVHQTFAKSIYDNEWMDTTTKIEAMNKIIHISENIAYPEWTMNDQLLLQYYDSYSDISVNDFFTSALNVIEAKKMQTFNFPAAIAQYPFYLMHRPVAMNLGSIGMIMAHEMTHALDLQGSLFDYKGDLRNWWTNTTREIFLNKSENIADNGGIREAYRALKEYQIRKPGEFQRLPGVMEKFTEEQLFFISFANMWCSNYQSDAIADTLRKQPHPPESVRVNGSLANFDRFTEAFHCKPGSKMFRKPEERYQ
ncbi:unnamed protein product [Oppiella nova]|uniref:Uncharacterized protein n=1 Tax=Oppiella nova TaxID=334625 RepID=A0A7R9LTY6_9ACAR|nr:unnamed protein product [Oppiella nova]CAG2166950.1 unnamed protein product [Oppiella nova]